MRIQEINLAAFGPFTDTTLDLSAGEPGLHIVFGPNEAGKSTTLRAIHGALYGIDRTTSDNFLHENSKLRVGATLQNAAGKSIRFLRRKGTKNTLLNPANKKGTALPEDALQTFLGGIDGDTFQSVYGIGHEELRAGGDELKSLQGLVGESLFAATVGGAGLADLLKSLDEEATAIFKSRKPSARLNVGKKRHAELKKEQREQQLPKSRWEKAQKEFDSAKKERDEIVTEQQACQRELNRLQRLQNAAGLIVSRARLQKQLAELQEARVLPAEYSNAQRSDLQAELNSVERDCQRLQQTLRGNADDEAGAVGLRERIDAIDVPPALLDNADAIEELRDARAVTLKAAQDTTKLQRDCETLQIEAEHILRDLGIEADFENVAKFRLTLDERLKIQNLASDEKRLRNAPQVLGEQQAAIAQQLSKVQVESSELGETRDTRDLEKALTQIQRHGDLQGELTAIRQQLEQQRRSASQHLKRQGLWSGELEDVVALAVPMRETIDRFAREFADTDQQLSVLTGRLEKANNDLRQIQEQIDALQLAGDVPTEKELQRLRGERDEQWAAIRDSLPSGDSQQAGLFSDRDLSCDIQRFDDAIREADDLADRLRRETERVTQLAEREARRQQIRSVIESTQQDADRLHDRRAEQAQQWQDQWSACGIVPLTPNEMAAWLARLSELQNVVADISEKQQQTDSLEQRIADETQRLSELLNALEISSRADADLDELCECAAAAIADEQHRAQRRERLAEDIQRLEAEQQQVQQKIDRAEKQHADWLTDWKTCMQTIGAKADATAEQANQRLSHFERLNEISQKIAQQEKRLRDIGSDSEAFEKDVARLADQFLSSAEQNQPATDQAELLSQSLATAQRDETERRQLQAQLETTEQSLHASETRREEIRMHLRALCELAGVKTVDELPRVERESDEFVRLRNQLEDAEDQLSVQAGGETLNDFVQSAAEHDPDELSIRISELESRHADLKQRRDEAVVRVSTVEAELREYSGGSSAAAACDQDALGVLSQMQDDAAQYIRLRFASTILRERIERLRAENADPLLERASALFKRMTCEEYSGVQTAYENDAPVIVGVRQDSSEHVHVGAMSDGTRDQLYLALRLGYVERRLVQHEPLPFIVDDILIHFDDSRSAATLEVLAELATQTQVIFLTHHIHLVELARTRLADDQCFVHHLDSRLREPVLATAAITKQHPR